MRHWIVVLGLAAMVPGSLASADDAPQKAVWGPLAEMAGHDYVAVHAGTPQTIVSFRWEKPGRLLIVTGLKSDGGTFRGQYELQPTGRIDETIRRSGKLTRSEYKATPEGFVEGGDQDGVQVRRVYRRVSATTLVSLNQTLVKGVWQITRNDGTMIQASPAWIKQLGWRPKAS